MKLIIDIPEEYISSDTCFYEWVEKMKADEYKGKITLLDSVIKDIKAEMFKAYKYVNMYYCDDQVSCFASIVCKVLDNIGKAESEDI